ncbi:hypothetical protein IPZ58_13530 [Streptomyces roseoverticillatus]|uniref:hypothetical protein n=1 Tax=Streptomyces roseoverticillatus TaxID=66429 RepID=UPI001F454706|nr:hypothetical protein [Streptomyces roseoverticillatus]MCF3102602.1 hypothetical protein [Streptomyces roseoverticillatus]
MLAVPGDVAVDDLVVVRSAGAPVQDLPAGQVLENQFLVVVDVRDLRGRGGDGRTGRGQHDRDHRRGRNGVPGLRQAGINPALERWLDVTAAIARRLIEAVQASSSCMTVCWPRKARTSGTMSGAGS